MSDNESNELKCILSLDLFKYGVVNSSFNASLGLARSFELTGRIDDPRVGPMGDLYPGEPGSPFHGKKVCIRIQTPPDKESLEEIRVKYFDRADNSCGFLVVEPGVEPKKYEFDGEVVEDAPIKAILHLDSGNFEAIRCHAAEAFDQRRILMAKITLIGSALPETTSKVERVLGIKPKDLDISAESIYGIKSLEISNTRYFDHCRGRVLEIERRRDEPYGAVLSILLTHARYEHYVTRDLIRKLSCDGRIINSGRDSLDGATVEVEFREHEQNLYGELPERAFFGEFTYFQNSRDEENSSTQFSLNLKYIPTDVRDLLMPLFSHELGTQVVLNVILVNQEDDLLAATEVLQGNVRSYWYEVSRDLTDDT